MRVAPLMIALAGCTDNNLIQTADETLTQAPAIEVNPTVLDLGRLFVGEQTTNVFRITNVGGSELHIEDVVVTRFEHRASLTLAGTPSLPPGGSVDVTIDAEAVVVGREDGIIKIASDDPLRRSVDLPVILRGIGIGTPAIELTPAYHDFGVVNTTSSPTFPVTVKNVGDGALNVSGLRWASSSEAELMLASDGKLSVGALLLPGELRDLLVEYAPNDGSKDEASLVIYSDDPALPEAKADFFGEGDETVTGAAHDVEVWLTADDQWEGTLDGVDVTGPNAAGWGASDNISATLYSGEHVLAVHAWDVASSVSGFVAVVKVDGAEYLLTGDSRVRMSTSKPGAGWQNAGYDDSAWTTPKVCASSAWGGAPYDLFAEGAAKWVWTSTNCAVLGEAWFRIPITLP